MDNAGLIYEIGKIPYGSEFIPISFFAVIILSVMIIRIVKSKREEKYRIISIIGHAIVLVIFIYFFSVTIRIGIDRYNEIYKPYVEGNYQEVSGEIENIIFESEDAEMEFMVGDVQFALIDKMPGYSMREFDKSNDERIRTGDFVTIRYIYSESLMRLYGFPYVILYIERIDSLEQNNIA